MLSELLYYTLESFAFVSAYAVHSLEEMCEIKTGTSGFAKMLMAIL